MRILVLVYCAWLIWSNMAYCIGGVLYACTMARLSYRLQREPESLIGSEAALAAYAWATNWSRLLAAPPAAWLLSILW